MVNPESEEEGKAIIDWLEFWEMEYFCQHTEDVLWMFTYPHYAHFTNKYRRLKSKLPPEEYAKICSMLRAQNSYDLLV
jgi:hypothetical protein